MCNPVTNRVTVLTLRGCRGELSASDGFRPSQALMLLVITGIWNVSQGQTSTVLGLTSLNAHSHPTSYGKGNSLAFLSGKKASEAVGSRIEPRGQHRTPYLFS